MATIVVFLPFPTTAPQAYPLRTSSALHSSRSTRWYRFPRSRTAVLYLQWKVCARDRADSRYRCLSHHPNRSPSRSRNLICTVWRQQGCHLLRIVPLASSRSRKSLRESVCIRSPSPNRQSSSVALFRFVRSVAAMVNTDQLSVVKFSFLYVLASS